MAAVVLILLFTRLAADSSAAAHRKGKLTNAAGGDGRVHSRRYRPAGHRPSRRRPLPAVSADGLLLRRWPATCSAWCPGPVRPPGPWRTTGVLALLTFVRGGVLGHGQAGAGRSSGWPRCRTWICRQPMAFLPQADDFRHRGDGLCIKHFILAMRLLANMMAGHLVLAVILAFIAASCDEPGLVGASLPASVLGASGAEHARAVRGVYSSVHLHVLVRPVHWHGGASALVFLKQQST